MGLNPRPRPDTHCLLDFGKRADKAIVTNLASVKITRLDQFDARTEDDISYTDVIDAQVRVMASRRDGKGAG